MAKKKSPYRQVKEARPRWYMGKTLTRIDVREIEAMFKRIRGLEAALRDLQERKP